jgi:hypothetical protein
LRDRCPLPPRVVCRCRGRIYTFEGVQSHGHCGLRPRCFTVLHAAPRRSTLLHAALRCSTLLYAAPRCSTLLHATPRCSTLLHAAPRCSTLLHVAPRCSTLLHAASRCSMLRIKRIKRSNMYTAREIFSKFIFESLIYYI